MQTPPEIIFHSVHRSKWVENYIVERLQRLEKFAHRITSCRVSLAQEQASHHKGNRYSVLVEARMPPNHDLAVRKTPGTCRRSCRGSSTSPSARSSAS
jgi:hypothetical protein